MKILFVVPRVKSLFGDKVAVVGHPHIGVAYLSSFLKSKGIEVKVYDESVSLHTELYKQITCFKPDFIGITIFSYCYEFAESLIRLIRCFCKKPIIAGGSHISSVKKDAFKLSIDYAIKGEGEYTLSELLQGKDPEGILGLIWNKGNEIIENEDRPYITDLDSLPFPDYQNIELYPCFKTKGLPIITSRGCPFKCNYCSVRLCMGNKFRPRSAENVFSEIMYHYTKGYRTFDINDDCFTLDQERAEKICDLIIENRLNLKFQLYNGIRADTITLPLLKKMRRAGCYFISIGCESGSPKVLKAINKGIVLEQVRTAVIYSNWVGISNAVNFIIGHKEETYEDALQTLRFAKSLNTNFVNFFNLIPYPGTESYDWIRENGKFLQENFLERWSYRDNEPIYETKDFTKAQRKEIMNKGFELYRRKIMTFRFGICGHLIYFLTIPKFMLNMGLRFIFKNKIGRYLYIKLARR